MKKPLLIAAIIFLSQFAIGQTIVYSENFDTPPHQVNNSTCSGPNWFTDTVLFKSAPNSYRDTLGFGTAGYEVCFETNSFSTVGNNYVTLEFDHICKIFVADSGIIEVSNDGGLNWHRLDSSHYLGTTSFLNTNIFNSTTYGSLVWYPTKFDTIPDATWFRNEKFDISNLAANSPNVKLRFTIIPQLPLAGNRKHYGWVLDNIVVTTNTTVSTTNLINGNKDIFVFPNPAKEWIYVKLAKTGPSDVKLFDVTGRIVISETLVDSRMLALRHLPFGVYKIQIVQNMEMQNGTVIIAR